MSDPGGAVVAVETSAANRHDNEFLLPLIFDHFPIVGEKVGRPRQQPRVVRVDAGYRGRHRIELLSQWGTETMIPSSRQDDRQRGLGRHRWPVERTISWLKQVREVGTRRARDVQTYQSFVTLGLNQATVEVDFT